MGYEYIFYMAACVGLILLLINTFFYKEPISLRDPDTPQKSVGETLLGILTVLKDFKFIIFILLYSGFWILYFQMYGTVLWYLRDYMDMTPVNNAVNSLLGLFVENPSWVFDTEHVTVVNAGVIICLQLFVSKIVAKTRPLPTMITGLALGTLGMLILSISSKPWVFITGLMVFTLGEMTTHPKFLSYIGMISPPDKKALYMGYSFLYGVIGSSIGSFLGSALYVKFVDEMGRPGQLWALLSIIGIVSIIGLLIYNRVVVKSKATA